MLNPCKLCSALCCKEPLITVTSFDVLRVIEKTDKKIEEFAELTPLKIINFDNDTVLECYEGKLRYEYLLAFKSHPCYFLKDNLCTIHEFAPLACKLYPYQSNDKLMPRALCPSISKLLFRIKKPDIKAEHYLEEMNSYKKVVAKWNVLHGKKDECLEFLLDESKKYKT